MTVIEFHHVNDIVYNPSVELAAPECAIGQQFTYYEKVRRS